MRIWLPILLSMFCQMVFASGQKGKEKIVEGSFMVEIPSYLSYDQACHEALIKAKNQAIENEFGSTVARVDQILLSNINGKSETNYFSINEGVPYQVLSNTQISTSGCTIKTGKWR